MSDAPAIEVPRKLGPESRRDTALGVVELTLAGEVGDNLDPWSPGGRGDSAYMHDKLRGADLVDVQGPRNHCPTSAAPAYACGPEPLLRGPDGAFIMICVSRSRTPELAPRPVTRLGMPVHPLIRIARPPSPTSSRGSRAPPDRDDSRH